jgi:hypothetical protein
MLLAVTRGPALQTRTRHEVTLFAQQPKKSSPAKALMRTGRFIVVERQALGDIVREQELGQSGLLRRETAAPTGQVLGAQIVVRGAVTECEARASGGGAGAGRS